MCPSLWSNLGRKSPGFKRPVWRYFWWITSYSPTARAKYSRSPSCAARKQRIKGIFSFSIHFKKNLLELFPLIFGSNPRESVRWLKVLAWEPGPWLLWRWNSFGNSQQLHVSMGPFPSLESIIITPFSFFFFFLIYLFCFEVFIICVHLFIYGGKTPQKKQILLRGITAFESDYC